MSIQPISTDKAKGAPSLPHEVHGVAIGVTQAVPVQVGRVRVMRPARTGLPHVGGREAPGQPFLVQGALYVANEPSHQPLLPLIISMATCFITSLASSR